MKKAIALFITLVFFIAILAACQATPERACCYTERLRADDRKSNSDRNRANNRDIAGQMRLGTPKTLSEELNRSFSQETADKSDGAAAPRADALRYGRVLSR